MSYTKSLHYYSRAMLYQDRGEKEKAAEFFSKAIEACPYYADAQEGLRKVQGS